MHVRGGWPKLFGSLVGGIALGYGVRHTEESNEGSVVVSGTTSEKSNFLLNTTDLDNQSPLLHPMAELTGRLGCYFPNPSV